MKRFLVLTLLALSLIQTPVADARTVQRGKKYEVRSTILVWTDLSSKIPTTKLDEYTDVPYLSIATSRGDQWLVGNKNQLFSVTGGNVKDLTPELKNSGFVSIRQVSGDGQAWLVIGDSGYWNSQPDLAFLYDGMYWKNVSFLMSSLPPEEWVGTIVGKRGLWVIPTSHGVYQWDTALTQPAAVAYPSAFSEPGASDVKFHAVDGGWIAEYTQPNGPKTKNFGGPVFDRRFFFFDGTTFKEISGTFRGLGDRSIVGSDGNNIFTVGVARNLPRIASIQGFVSDGQNTTDISVNTRRLWDIRETRPLLVNGRAVWTGKGWLLTDEQNNIALCDIASCRMQTKTRDTILESGYGKNGQALLVGFERDSHGNLKPRMGLVEIK